MRARTYSPARRLLMAIWGLWETLWVRCWRLYEIPGDPHRVVRIGFRRWSGPAVELAGGTVVRHGDWVGEIHLNNPRFARVWEESGGSPAAAVARLSAEIRRALRSLAGEVQAGRLPVAPVAFFGKTLIDRGLARMGFEVRELPNTPGHRWLARYARWLLSVYHPAGLAHAAGKHGLRCAWLTVDELVRRYAQNAPAWHEGGATAATRVLPPRTPTAGPT